MFRRRLLGIPTFLEQLAELTRQEHIVDPFPEGVEKRLALRVASIYLSAKTQLGDPHESAIDFHTTPEDIVQDLHWDSL